jgi:hypothetical protein
MLPTLEHPSLQSLFHYASCNVGPVLIVERFEIRQSWGKTARKGEGLQARKRLAYLAHRLVDFGPSRSRRSNTRSLLTLYLNIAQRVLIFTIEHFPEKPHQLLLARSLRASFHPALGECE